MGTEVESAGQESPGCQSNKFNKKGAGGGESEPWGGACHLNGSPLFQHLVPHLSETVTSKMRMKQAEETAWSSKIQVGANHVTLHLIFTSWCILFLYLYTKQPHAFKKGTGITGSKDRSSRSTSPHLCSRTEGSHLSLVNAWRSQLSLVASTPSPPAQGNKGSLYVPRPQRRGEPCRSQQPTEL